MFFYRNFSLLTIQFDEEINLYFEKYQLQVHDINKKETTIHKHKLMKNLICILKKYHVN
jgi:hypothetical protein